MKNFFVKKIKNNLCFFTNEDANHLKNVLRIKLGDKVNCIYKQKKYQCQINSIDPLNALIIQEVPTAVEFKNHNIILYQAVIKPKHQEWILAKATELGISQIALVIFSRSQPKNIILDHRIQNIILSSAKQSGRQKLPIFSGNKKFNDLLTEFSQLDCLIVPYENEDKVLLANEIETIDFTNLKNIGLLIGPEGGFTNQEIDIIKMMTNVKLVQLTKTILRSDTASFFTLSILINHLFKKGL